jgi:16S rRNA (guanine527-N7)-methyltransferase
MDPAGAGDAGGAEEPLSELELAAHDRLAILVRLLGEDARVPSSVTEPERAWRVHVADSLAGLRVQQLRDASRIADLGAGAGFPGLVLAVALPETAVDLIEATARKCEFMRRAIDAMGVPNARVVNDRAESWGAHGAGGRESYDAVAARAVARLSTLSELASPLLAEGGALVAWKGRRNADEEAEAERATPRTAMEPLDVLAVEPYPESQDRHLHIYAKRGPTPNGVPRRPGMARKRPFGSSPSG